jgi:hypothetical protein
MQSEVISLEASRGRIRLRLHAVAMGRDLCVTLAGGERAHIGAVALSQARPSLDGGGGISASTSVLTLAGHKEDDLARAISARLARHRDGSVCVACGIHVDAILPSELQDVQELAEELVARLLGQW